MTKYLIALDLDGTLLTSNGTISSLTRDYLHNLESAGHIILIASGRPMRALKHFYEQLGLTSPIIFYNGACARSPYDNNFPAFTFAFPQQTIKSIYQEVESYVNNIMCETNNRIWLLKEDYVLKDFFWHDDTEITYGSLNETLNEDPLTMIIEVKKLKYKKKILTAINKHPFLAIRFWSGKFEKFCEVYYREVSKAACLKKIAEYYHIDRQQVIAFGDAENDLEMISWAGIGVAMKNAIPLLKARASMISEDDNDHDGIVKTLQKILK